MIFVIDIGNTHTVAGIYDQRRITKQWRIKTDSAMTADELKISFHNLFTISKVDVSQITGVIFSSVVPQLDAAYFSCCTSLFELVQKPACINVTADIVADLITILLEHPAEVGADRLVNGIAAFHLSQRSSIVIDFGTAITFDCISEHCEYIGGLILPGLSIALQALTQNTAKLPQIDITTPPENIIGTSTVSAMKSGVLYGYGAMVEGLIQQVKQQMDPENSQNIAIIATGGMAKLIQSYAPSIERVEPNLTLNGLALIYQKLYA
jgi:type III pantothenate kinase